MKTSKSLLIVLIVVAIGMVFAMICSAQSQLQGMKDEMRIKYYDAFQGKRVVYVPMSLGFDLTAGWGATMRKKSDRFEIKFKFVILIGTPTPVHCRVQT